MSQVQQDRKFKRMPLTQETAAAALQTKGVPATLLRDSFFDFLLCHAILKDISLGGAGALVPKEKKVPDKIKVLIADKISLKAKVVHRKAVSKKLLFLGLDWSSESDKKCRQAINIVSQLSYQGTQVHADHAQDTKK